MQVIISEIIEGINPLVSVDIITYNHEKYAAEAIEGVLMQKTNFKYEIVICDDCSTDNTREILLDHQKKYPDKIILRFQEKNVGLRYNYFENKKACRGKYIAICEGDDIYVSSDIYVNLDVEIGSYIGNLVIGFNIYSSSQYPIARSDYNDISQQTTLPIGKYHFSFHIPPYTLADGDYYIKFDVAERNVKNYATENSFLKFRVKIDGKNRFGNVFNENSSLKTSIIKSRWQVECLKID